MTLLARVGLATAAGMAAKRKYAIVGVFIVAAIFTPPDPLSQVSLAVQIIILYEISILMAKMVEKKRAAAEAEDDFNLDADEGLRSEEHTSELQSLMSISYAVFCLKKKKKTKMYTKINTIRVKNNKNLKKKNITTRTLMV